MGFDFGKGSLLVLLVEGVFFIGLEFNRFEFFLLIFNIYFEIVFLSNVFLSSMRMLFVIK